MQPGTSAVVMVTLAAFAIGGAGLYLASRHADAATRRERLVKFEVYFGIVAVVLLCGLAGQQALAALALAIGGRGAFELYGSLRAPGSGFRTAVCAAYMFLGVAWLSFAIVLPPASVIYAYLIVAAFDGFSQVTGQGWGQRHFAPRISPGKTIEGAAGGALAAVALAVVLRGLANQSVAAALVLGALLVVAALAGDLSASWVKRKSGVKDFGHLLPGHGGVLDRFDSMLFAAPVALAMLSRARG